MAPTRHPNPQPLDGPDSERGAVLVFVSFMLVALLGLASLVIDVGQLYWTRRSLQNAADAATLAAVREFPSTIDARAVAVDYADRNRSGSLAGGDVEFGHWNPDAGYFQPGGTPIDTIRVTTRETVNNSFARVLGINQSDVAATSIATLSSSSIDFEGPAPGDEPATVSVGYGISGHYIPGYVTITGSRHGPMIFDATCNGGPASQCTGGDPDLFQPAQGNVLILSEDGDSNDPDDDARGGWLEFDFSQFGSGSVTVGSLVLIDAEEGGSVFLYSDGELVDVAILGGVGDGEKEYRFVSDVPGVDRMRIEFGGSGALDDIGYQTVAFLVG